ncbi:phosphatase PAP2 family protein [Altererythrobacter sp. TH136]|uniref:phosphatase PAP2 family protein n=1 Tax=Altererythrobacter sp. TH136 TaxID=2067415 RepID=UPI001162B04A|nr:phosphatase PAP2 family protein [Altererythrobacter sp. TH136]QDM40174.1 hypothetical protein C0V74_03195 [Altererythrobacter sp. TH136]
MNGLLAARAIALEHSPTPPTATWTARHGLTSLLAIVLGSAAMLAGAILMVTGTSLEWAVFARFAALATGMALVSLWCSKRQLDPRMAAAAAIVAAAILSLMFCAVISHVGLKLEAPLMDARLARADAALGFHVDRAVRAAAYSPHLIDVLAFVYNASGVVVVALILAVLGTGSTGRAWELTATIVIAMQVVAALSILMPAIGAMHHFGLGDLQGRGLPVGAGVYHLQGFAHFYGGSDPVARLSDMTGLVTFPSFHTVLALMATQALAPTRLRWVGVAWTSMVIVSTVPVGGHYAVDLAAGFVIWALAAAISQRVSTPSA